MLYITERAVFELTPRGLRLAEAAPGIDIRTQILELLPFEVEVGSVQRMDPRLFRESAMGLGDDRADAEVAHLPDNTADLRAFRQARDHVAVPLAAKPPVAAQLSA